MSQHLHIVREQLECFAKCDKSKTDREQEKKGSKEVSVGCLCATKMLKKFE
jgi:hypothetical protein